jgi:hypothetical protein
MMFLLSSGACRASETGVNSLLTSDVLSCSAVRTGKIGNTYLQSMLSRQAHYNHDSRKKMLKIDTNTIQGVNSFKTNTSLSNGILNIVEMSFSTIIYNQSIGKLVIQEEKTQEGESLSYYYIIMNPKIDSFKSFATKFQLVPVDSDTYDRARYEKLPSGNIRVWCMVAG